MTTDSSRPLDGIDPASVTADGVDATELRAALTSSRPLVRQRGVEVCETLAAADVDAVLPFLDAVASLTADEFAPAALRAIAVLNTVRTADPAALDGRLTDLVATMGTDHVAVQLTGAVFLGNLVVERPEAVAPHTRTLVDGLRATEPDPERGQFEDVVDDPDTRQALAEQERAEQDRLLAARRTLANVVVAVTEQAPSSALSLVDDLCSLLTDDHAPVAGCALDALGELAKTDASRVAPVTDRIVARLDDERPVVRARAIRALGNLGAASVVPDLRRVASTDDDESVRDLAAATADFLDADARTDDHGPS